MRAMVLLLMLALAAAPRQAAAAERVLTVFAAASLTDAFRDIGEAWRREGHPSPAFSFASSSTLARQIIAGAPADLFASADEAWMDAAQKAGRIAPGTRADVAANRLVLIGRRDRARKVALQPAALDALLGPSGRLALGDPGHVPAGIYAKQALTRLHLWDALSPRLAPAADVRAALLLVARGEAPAGIVYATDALAAPDVIVLATFPAASHDPIRYPVALTPAGDTADGRAFLAFLRGPEARAILTHWGFLAP